MATRRHSIPVLILCTALAVLLWSYVALTRISEDDVTMPLVVVAPTNQALLSQVPSTINVRVRGTGLQILNLKYIQRSSACTVNLGRIRPIKDTVFDITRDEILRSISTPQSVRTVGVHPSQMLLTVGELAVKNVKVLPNVSISPREGFMLVGQPVVEPASVEVRGSSAIIGSLTSWHTLRYAEADAYMNVNADVPVSDSLASLVNVVPSNVNLKVNIQQVSQMEFSGIPVTVGRVGFIPSPSLVRIVVRGGVEHLARLTSADFKAEVTPSLDGSYQYPKITCPANITVLNTTYVRTLPRINRELSP